MSGNGFRRRGFGPRVLHSNGPGGGFGSGFGGPRFPRPNFAHSRPACNRLPRPDNWVGPAGRPTVFLPWQQNINYVQRPLFRGNAPCRPNGRGGVLYARGTCRFSGPGRPPLPHVNVAQTNNIKPRMVFTQEQHNQDKPNVQPQIPPLGSEEERQRKITETVDRLKLKLSSITKEEITDFWEDDLSTLPLSVPTDNTELKIGIPELRHEPPELNLTFNDFRDIGRVDLDNAKSESTENVNDSIDATVNDYDGNSDVNIDTSQGAENKRITSDKDLNEFVEILEIRDKSELRDSAQALLICEEDKGQEKHDPSKIVHNMEQINLHLKNTDQNASINISSKFMDSSSINNKIQFAKLHDNQCLKNKTINPEHSHTDVSQNQEKLQAMQTPDRNVIELDKCLVKKNPIVHSQQTCNIMQTRISLEEDVQVSVNVDDSLLSYNTACDHTNFKQKVQTSQAISPTIQNSVGETLASNSDPESKFRHTKILDNFTHLDPKPFAESTSGSADLSAHGDRQPFTNQVSSPVQPESIDVVFDPCTPPPCSHIKGASFHDSRAHIPSSFLSKDVLPNVDFREPPPNMQTEPRSDAKTTLDPLETMPLSIVQNQSQLPSASPNTMHTTRLLLSFDPKEPPPSLRSSNKLKNLPGFNPQQPPPIIPNRAEVLQPPPAFDPRLSSQQRSHLMVQTSLETCASSIIQTNNMETLQIPDFSANLAANVNFSQLPLMNVPPPQPFIQNIQANFQLALPHTNVHPRIEHGFTAPPPPPVYLSEIPSPPPIQSLHDIDNQEQNVNMDDGLDDMHNAMEFAKQVMNMTAETEINQPTVKSVLEESSIVQSEVSKENIDTVTSLQLNETTLAKKKEKNQSEKEKARDSEQAVTSNGGNLKDNSSTRIEESVQHKKLITTKVPLVNEQRRPKVMFNLNSKSRMINQREEWRSRNETTKTKKQRSTASTDISKTNRRPVFRERKAVTKKVLDQKRNSANKITVCQPAVKAKKVDEHQKKIDRIFATATFHAQHSMSNIVPPINVNDGNNEFNKKEIKDSPALETSWKSRVINRFLKMSKNDICNMVNNSSLRKFDIAMKHLVKEKRSSLSLQMRNSENEKIKEYDRTEFMNQLNAMLDPGATVDMSDLPTEFIHHLSEVLQLDPMPLETTDAPARVEVVQKDAENLTTEEGLSTSFLLDNIKEEIPDNESNMKHDTDSSELDHMSNKSEICEFQSDHLVQNEAADRDTPECAMKVEQGNICSAQRQLFNVCNLDDIFSVVSEQARNICTSQEYANNSIMDSHDSYSLTNTELRNFTDESASSQHSERRIQELDKIFLKTLAKEKLTFNRNVNVSSNINVHRANGMEAGNVRRRKSSSEDRNMFRMQKYESWSRRKPEDLDAFRNLTKEEWEAKYGKSTNQSGSNSSDNILNRERDKSNTQSKVYPSDSSTTHSSPLERENIINRRKNVQKYELRTKEHETKSFTSESESSTSSTSEGSTYGTAPEVSKLLKVIKEKEKIAKIRSLNETIRDEVTAEIERKWKQKSKNKERKSRKHEKKRHEKKMKRKRIKKKKKKKLLHSSMACLDEEIAKKDRILMEDEIKKEVVIKEEPDFPEESMTYNSMDASPKLDNEKTIESSYSFENATESARIEESQVLVGSSTVQQLQSQNKDVITGMALQQKTKAQLKQLPPSPDMKQTQSVQDFNRISIQSESTIIKENIIYNKGKHTESNEENTENSSSHQPMDENCVQCKDNLNPVDNNLLTMSNTPVHIMQVPCKGDSADQNTLISSMFITSGINDVLNVHTDHHPDDNNQNTSVTQVPCEEKSAEQYKPILPSFTPPGINDVSNTSPKQNNNESNQCTSIIQASHKENIAHQYKPTLPVFIPPAINDVFSISTNHHINDNKHNSENGSRCESTGNKTGLKKIDIKAYKARALQRKMKEQSQLQRTTNNISSPPSQILSNINSLDQESVNVHNQNMPTNLNIKMKQHNTPESFPLITLVATSKLLSEKNADSFCLNMTEEHMDKSSANPELLRFASNTDEILPAASKHPDNNFAKSILHGIDDKNIEYASSAGNVKSISQAIIEKGSNKLDCQPQETTQLDRSVMSAKTIASTNYGILKFKNIRSEGIKELKLKKERRKRQKEKKATLEHITDRILSKRKRLSTENLDEDMTKESQIKALSENDRAEIIPSIRKFEKTEEETKNVSLSDFCNVAENISRLEHNAAEEEITTYPKVAEGNDNSEFQKSIESLKQDKNVSKPHKLTTNAKSSDTSVADLDLVVDHADIEKANKVTCASTTSEYHETNVDLSNIKTAQEKRMEKEEPTETKNNNTETQALNSVKYAEGTIQNNAEKTDVRENEDLRHTMVYHNNDKEADIISATEVNKNVDTFVRSLTESLNSTTDNKLSPVNQILSEQVMTNELEKSTERNLLHWHHCVNYDDKSKKTSDKALANRAKNDEDAQKCAKSETATLEFLLNKDIQRSRLDENNVSSPDSLDTPFKGFVPENLAHQSIYDTNKSSLGNENVNIEENKVCRESYNRKESCLTIASKKNKPDPKLSCMSMSNLPDQIAASDEEVTQENLPLDNDSSVNTDTTNISNEHKMEMDRQHSHAEIVNKHDIVRSTSPLEEVHQDITKIQTDNNGEHIMLNKVHKSNQDMCNNKYASFTPLDECSSIGQIPRLNEQIDMHNLNSEISMQCFAETSKACRNKALHSMTTISDCCTPQTSRDSEDNDTMPKLLRQEVSVESEMGKQTSAQEMEYIPCAMSLQTQTDTFSMEKQVTTSSRLHRETNSSSAVENTADHILGSLSELLMNINEKEQTAMLTDSVSDTIFNKSSVVSPCKTERSEETNTWDDKNSCKSSENISHPALKLPEKISNTLNVPKQLNVPTKAALKESMESSLHTINLEIHAHTANTILSDVNLKATLNSGTQDLPILVTSADKETDKVSPEENVEKDAPNSTALKPAHESLTEPATQYSISETSCKNVHHDVSVDSEKNNALNCASHCDQPLVNNNGKKKISISSPKKSKEIHRWKVLHTTKNTTRMKRKKLDRHKIFKKQEKVAVDSDIVQMASNPNTRESIMARMIAIDLEIHKLMTEKMTLYQMLESKAVSTSNTSTNSGIADRHQEKVILNRPDTPSALMSQLMQNLDNGLVMPLPLTCKTKTDSVSGRKFLPSEEHKLHRKDRDDEEISSCASSVRSSVSNRKKKQKSVSVVKCQKLEENYSMQETCMEKQQKSNVTKGTSEIVGSNVLQENLNKDVPISVSQIPLGTSEREISAISNKCDIISDSLIQHNVHMIMDHTSAATFKKSKNANVEKGGLVDSIHEEYSPGKKESNFTSSMLDKRSGNNAPKEESDYSNNSNQEAETLEKERSLGHRGMVVKSPQETSEKLLIYSDDSTRESYIQNSMGGVHDRKKLNTGLALLEEAYRRETAKSRKLRIKARRAQKERLRCLLKSVNNLTPEEEELPLSVLYVKKLHQKRDLLEALGDKTEMLSCNEDPKTWEHVVEVINAVAENRVQDLYKSNPDEDATNDSQLENQIVSPHSFSSSIKNEFRKNVISSPNSMLSHVKYGEQDTIVTMSKPINRISVSDSEKETSISTNLKISDSNSEIGATSESLADRKRFVRSSAHAMCYEKRAEETCRSDLSREDKLCFIDFLGSNTESAAIQSITQSDFIGLNENLIHSSQRLQLSEENNNLNTIKERSATESYRTSDLPSIKQEVQISTAKSKNILSFGSTLEGIEQALEDERIQKSVMSKMTTDGENSYDIHKDCNKNTVNILNNKTTVFKTITKPASRWIKNEEQDKSCRQVEESLYNMTPVADKEKILLIHADESQNNDSGISETTKGMPSTLQSMNKDQLIIAQEKKEKSKEPTNPVIKGKHGHFVTMNIENSSEDMNDLRSKVCGRKRLISGSSSTKTSKYSENGTKRTKLSHTNVNNPSPEHCMSVQDKNVERYKVSSLDNEESEYVLVNTKRSRKLKKSLGAIDGKYKLTESGVPSMDRYKTHENVRRVSRSMERSATKDEAVQLTCKRKQHTRQEMMNCKVKLIDSKYTILRPDVNINVLRRLGISSINIYPRQKTVQTEDDVDKMQETSIIEEMETISNVNDHLLEVATISQSQKPDLNDDCKTSIESSGNQDCVFLKEKRVRKINASPNKQNEVLEPDINITLLQTKQGATEALDILKDDTRLEIEVVEEKNVGKNQNITEVELMSEMTEVEDVEYARTEYVAHKGPILDIKVFGNSFLAASEDGTIYRYSQTSNIILNTYKGHKSAITCLYIYKTGCTELTKERLYSGSLDGTLRSYNIMTGAQTNSTADVGSPIQCMDQAWGMIFIGTKSGQVSRFHMKSGTIKGSSIQFSDKSVLALKATSEGSRRVLIVASRNQPITIRDAQSGLFLRSISGDKSHTVYSLMRDNSLIYCGTSGTSIPVFDFTSGEQVMQYDAGVGIVCMRLFKQLLFAGCYDGNIYVFDTKDHNLVCSMPGPGNMLLSMEVINDKIIAGSKDRQLQMWRMPKQVCILLRGKT
ncbi:hypothetical protein KM043_009768 [Ampulex compressa]|nr:hypothetical protein KM043_009768 [Ampulex compressa]